jgi:hypothetical protein
MACSTGDYYDVYFWFNINQFHSILLEKLQLIIKTFIIIALSATSSLEYFITRGYSFFGLLGHMHN